MRIDEIQWLDVWIFLSLDIIRPYQKELMLSFLNLDEYQVLLRKELDQIDQNDVDWKILASKICNKVYNNDVNIYFKLSWWLRSVFCAGGEDRAAEFIWSNLAIMISRGQSQYAIPNWVMEKMCIISDKDSEYYQKIKKKIIVPSNVSSWDLRIIKVNSQTIENILDQISLMILDNAFVSIWEDEMRDVDFEKLCELYIIGKEIAGNQMKGVHINFPGIWKYDFDEYKSIVNK